MTFISSFYFYSMATIFYFVDIGLLFFMHTPVTAFTMALFVPTCMHESRYATRIVPLLLSTIAVSCIYPESTVSSIALISAIVLITTMLKTRILMHTFVTGTISLLCVFIYMIKIQHIPLSLNPLFVLNAIIALLCAFFYTKGKQIC